jgi:hypothetical protein
LVVYTMLLMILVQKSGQLLSGTNPTFLPYTIHHDLEDVADKSMFESSFNFAIGFFDVHSAQWYDLEPEMG